MRGTTRLPGGRPSEPAAIRSDAGADRAAARRDRIGEAEVRIEIDYSELGWGKAKCGKNSGRTRSHCAALVRIAIPGRFPG